MSPPEARPPEGGPLAAVVAREDAATEARQWVRLTRYCNNRCAFCHDAAGHDGSVAPLAEVEAQLRAGRERGATRLVLSGGEPTVHPAFAEIVALGRRAGYRWVQAISNGRMFAYPRFAERVVAAGLDEATISLHGHTAALHDEITGARGSFAQALRGLANLQRLGRVVSVDVVVCRPNVRHLEAHLRFLMGLGVREFDLLHLVPFGRAWDGRADELELDPAADQPHVLAALRLAALPGVHLWTNRWPAALLEGAEHLIQDPHKVLDELRGMRAELEGWLDGDGPPCRGARCPRCFLEPFCQALAGARRRLEAGAFPVVAVEAGAALAPGVRDAMARQRGAAIRLRAADGAAAADGLAALPGAGGAEVHLDLGRLEGLPAAVAPRVGRVVLRRDEDLAAALSLPRAALEIPVERATRGLLRRALEAAPARVRPVLPARARLAEVLARDLPPAELAAALEGAPEADAPPCLGPAASPEAPVLELDALRPDGRLDLLAFGARWVEQGWRVRSLRCGGCREAARCRGAHVNAARAFGFGWMRPLAAEGA